MKSAKRWKWIRQFVFDPPRSIISHIVNYNSISCHIGNINKSILTTSLRISHIDNLKKNINIYNYNHRLSKVKRTKYLLTLKLDKTHKKINDVNNGSSARTIHYYKTYYYFKKKYVTLDKKSLRFEKLRG